MPDTIRLRTPDGGEIRIVRAQLPLFLRRGCTVISDEEQAVEREVAALAAEHALPDDTAGDPPAKSASKAEWVAYATRLGVPDPDQFTKDELVDHLTDNTEE